MELARKKEDRMNSNKVNVWCCFSSQDFGGIVDFKQNFSAELMCDIYKRSLLPTARKQLSNCKKITTRGK